MRITRFGSLNIGDTSAAVATDTLTISGGGSLVTADASTEAGFYNSAVNTGVLNVTGTGSSLVAPAGLVAGAGGIGTVNITNSATVSAGAMYVGYIQGAAGRAPLTSMERDNYTNADDDRSHNYWIRCSYNGHQ